jgi:hypothetical protein
LLLQELKKAILKKNSSGEKKNKGHRDHGNECVNNETERRKEENNSIGFDAHTFFHITREWI